jgi:hypothetical protein
MDEGESPAAEFEPREPQGEGDRQDGEDEVGFVHGIEGKWPKKITNF